MEPGHPEKSASTLVGIDLTQRPCIVDLENSSHELALHATASSALAQGAWPMVPATHGVLCP